MDFRLAPVVRVFRHVFLPVFPQAICIAGHIMSDICYQGYPLNDSFEVESVTSSTVAFENISEYLHSLDILWSPFSQKYGHMRLPQKYIDTEM